MVWQRVLKGKQEALTVKENIDNFNYIKIKNLNFLSFYFNYPGAHHDKYTP